MKQTLNVEIQNYNIIISDEEISKLIDEVNLFTEGQKRLFVVSKKIYMLYKEYLNLKDSEVLVLNDGEKEKNFKNYIKILRRAKKLNLTRSDVLVALGGGVIGDITGFAASTYMRGIDYIQIPTTLLSMVDSSVGGKTAINIDDVKNFIGAFYQPRRVYNNINFLKTLDNRQFLSGVGEILKYAFIEESCGYNNTLFLFEYLTLSYEKLIAQDSLTIMRVIEHCLRLKIAVVNQDEKESGLRKILNLGHTYGHALEVLGKYKKFLHGEAVVQGILFVFNYAYANGLITYSYYRLTMDLLYKYGFKTIKTNFKPLQIMEVMKFDKKSEQDKIVFIVPYEKKKVKEIKLSVDDIIKMF